MILDIAVTVTEPDGNILTGSVAVTVNVPPAEAPPPAEAEAQLAAFQQRSLMMARGLSRL